MRTHTITFSRIFSAAHRLWNDESKCRNIHGHNYGVEVTINAQGELTPQGFTVPFDVVKREVDFFDHSLILDAADPFAERLASAEFGLWVILIEGAPSTERLADHLAVAIAGSVGREGLEGWVGVRLKETEGIEAHGHCPF